MGWRDKAVSWLLSRDSQAITPSDGQRSFDFPLSMNQWASMFTFGGLTYPFQMLQTSMQGTKEDIPQNFTGYVQAAYKANGVVFACMLARLMAFSEARFQFRQLRAGRPGDLFGTQELAVLEQPWPGATTGDLLARQIQDADLAGNGFVLRRKNQLKRLRPDWVVIIIGIPDVVPETEQDIAPGDLDAEVLGYGYCPGGFSSGEEIIGLGVDEVAHFAPIPDPTAQYRGMSWLTPVLREIMSDSAATSHKLKFFENAATVNLAITMDPTTNEDKFRRFIQEFREGHEGIENAYRTLVLAGGADVKPIGADLEQADFKGVQGGGETRIAAAAGVPPIVVGLSEGLQAATYSNYQLAMRRFADFTIRPYWRNFCGSMSRLVNVPPASELWYDDRDIPFLRQEVTDQAKILMSHASAMRQLIDGGFQPDTVVEYISSGDETRLKHTGLYSVQLQPPFFSMQGQPAALPGSLTPGQGPSTPKSPTPPQQAQPAQPQGTQPQANGSKQPAAASPAPKTKSENVSPYLTIEEIWGEEKEREENSNE